MVCLQRMSGSDLFLVANLFLLKPVNNQARWRIRWNRSWRVCIEWRRSLNTLCYVRVQNIWESCLRCEFPGIEIFSKVGNPLILLANIIELTPLQRLWRPWVIGALAGIPFKPWVLSTLRAEICLAFPKLIERSPKSWIFGAQLKISLLMSWLGHQLALLGLIKNWDFTARSANDWLLLFALQVVQLMSMDLNWLPLVIQFLSLILDSLLALVVLQK